ncbi:hypothetical protein [Bizionia paragorgiae]|uniref:hypothetical protein n=1 Tax=Bizionia paragorgiae TaxID=283786 RepID=UPI003A929807
MNSQNLIDHFKTGLTKYRLERKRFENNLSEEQIKKSPNNAIMELTKLLYGEILSELPQIAEQTLVNFNKGMNFKLGDEEKKKYLKDEIAILERHYHQSPFRHWFTIDNFHSEIFTENALKQIFDTFIEEIAKAGMLKENGELDIEKVSIIHKIKSELFFTFHIIMKAKIIKLEYANWRGETVQMNIQNGISANLIPHKNQMDVDGFPLNSNGAQTSLTDINGNVLIPLISNFFVKRKENEVIKFNPNNKQEARRALDNLVEILYIGFEDKLSGYFTIDLTDEAKKKYSMSTEKPLKVLKIQCYFDLINKWLRYLGNVFNYEFKLLFYLKFKEKIKNDILSFDTGLSQLKAPKNHIEFAKKWLKETDKIIKLEKPSKSITIHKQSPKNVTEKDFKEEIWFKVGLLFASGAMEKYYFINEKNKTIFKEGYSAPKVAKDLDNDNYNKFILATINDYPSTNPNGNKNIFNSREKMQKIIQHCIINRINITPYFSNRLPPE